MSSPIPLLFISSLCGHLTGCRSPTILVHHYSHPAGTALGMTKKQYERYAKGMMLWGFGYGLFSLPSDTDAHPGACGYIDDSGSWQKLVDLNDDAALKTYNLSKMDSQQLKPVSTEAWGPKFTNTVVQKDVTSEAKVSLESLGLPADCSAVFKYGLNSDFGAVLLCHDAVEINGYPHKEPFRQWAKANAKALQQRFRDIGRNGGFYVMTTTRSARDIYINAWANKENTITVGVKVEAAGLGGATQKISYYRGSAASGWHHPILTVRGSPPPLEKRLEANRIGK